MVIGTSTEDPAVQTETVPTVIVGPVQVVACFSFAGPFAQPGTVRQSAAIKNDSDYDYPFHILPPLLILNAIIMNTELLSRLLKNFAWTRKDIY